MISPFFFIHLRVELVGLGKLELPTYGLGIQSAVLIGVENF
jgi:hypothetical protein